MNIQSVVAQEPPQAAPGAVMHGRLGFDLSPVLADGALPVTIPVADQDHLLAGLEARLADEVGSLVDALYKFGRSAQAIGEELPQASYFGKCVTVLLSTLSFQMAYALLKDGDMPLLLDDGAQYLRKLGLCGDEFFREFRVEGRRFLAVALVEQGAACTHRGRQAGANVGDQ